MGLAEVAVDPDGPKGARAGTVTATSEHPFWVQNRRAWLAAKDLRPGDLLRTAAGTWVQVTHARAWASPHQRAHNLTIDSPHTYYVAAGSAAVLVHDAGPGCPWASSRILRGNLEARGEFATGDFEAHRIVPGGSFSGRNPVVREAVREAQERLAAFGIDVNDAANGVYLPRSVHRAVHTNDYLLKVARRLENVPTREGAVGARRGLGQKLHGEWLAGG